MSTVAAARILVVEDNQQDWEFLEQTLRDVPYAVSRAVTGEAAIEAIQTLIPDMVILDILLPDIDGFEVCQRIRKLDKGAGIPILFYTAVTTVNEKLIGLESGASDFLTKSSDRRELLVRIKNLLQVRRSIQGMIERAYVDDVTRTYNKRYVMQRLEEEYARSVRYQRFLSCVMVDIDRFGLINDNFGNHTGDRMLKRCAELLRDQVRGGDVLGRVGADDFVLLLPETSLQGAYQTAERIRKFISVTDAFKSECAMSVTISCGVSSLSKQMQDNTELLVQAGGALQEAKDQGANKTRAYAQDW